MKSIGEGEVMTIAIGGMTCTEETLCMGGEAIWTSEMRLGVTAFIEVTC